LVELSKEDERLAQIKQIMEQHVGKLGAISSRDLAEKLHIKERDTFSLTRSLIEKTMRRFSLPIGATNSKPPGYFLIETREELDQYMIILEQRILQIEGRKNLVFHNYVDKHGPFDEDED
jgi:hypothetical protein